MEQRKKVLTFQEEEIMKSIWSFGEACSVKQIIEKGGFEDVPYTTIASIVKNIEAKGYLKSVKYGKTLYYEPTIEQRQYSSSTIGRFVKDYFDGSYANMVRFFAEKEKISYDELCDIIDIIEKQK